MMNQFWMQGWSIDRFSKEKTLHSWANPKVEPETIFRFLRWIITNRMSLSSQVLKGKFLTNSISKRAQHIAIRSALLSMQCNSKILLSSTGKKILPQNLSQIKTMVLTLRNRKLRAQKELPMKSKWQIGIRRKSLSVHPWLVLHQNPPERKSKKSRNK